LNNWPLTFNHKYFTLHFIFCRREQVIRKVLVRYCILDDDPAYSEKETFLLDNLAVPVVWIHEAKVCLWKSPGCTSIFFKNLGAKAYSSFGGIMVCIMTIPYPAGMPVHRLGSYQHLTCERAYSGYEIGNMIIISLQLHLKTPQVFSGFVLSLPNHL
jgi:hypothetical protein